MRNILTFLPKSWLIPTLIMLSITALGKPATAQTPTNAPQIPTAPQPQLNNAPPQLVNLLSQIDAAANQRNLEAVLQFVSPNFTHSSTLR